MKFSDLEEITFRRSETLLPRKPVVTQLVAVERKQSYLCKYFAFKRKIGGSSSKLAWQQG